MLIGQQHDTVAQREAYAQAFLYSTVMHEVGHMLGADHVPSVNSLMYPIVSEGTELTEDDLNALAEKAFPQREPSF